MHGNSWKVTADSWKRTDIRDITHFRGSDAAPAGHISGGVLSMLFPKGNSMTTASRQCRESSAATGSLPLRIPSTKNILVIMKSGSSCVSRRKNRFWRLSGRGWNYRSLSGTPGWIKQSSMSATGVTQHRPIWRTDNAALPTISVKMRSVHLQWEGRTGCSAVPWMERMPVQ